MKRIFLVALALAFAASARASYDAKTGWIVNEHWNSGVPLGGIGVGKVEIYPDGWFGRATVNHNWDRPTKALAGALAIVAIKDGGKLIQRTLRMPAAAKGYNDLIPNVAKVAYRGTFPSAELMFRDPALPVKVDLHAWSSLIPNNAKDSSLPVAHLDYTVTNPSKRPLKVTLALGWPNYLGYGGRQGNGEWTSLAGNYEVAANAGIAKGLLFKTRQTYRTQRQNVVGEYFMGVVNPDATLQQMPTFDPHTRPLFINAFDKLTVRGFREFAGALPVTEPCGAVAVTIDIEPGRSKTIPFIVAWAMPTHRVTHRKIVGYTGSTPDDSSVNLTLDGDPATRWTTGRAMRPGDAIEIDLTEKRALGILTLESKASADDWPHGYKVETATDGPWTRDGGATLGATARSVKDGVLKIDLRGITAKRIRVTNTGLDGFYFWSIHELGLTDLDGKTVALTPGNVHAFISKPVYREITSNLGHYWQNSFHNVSEIVSYAADNAGRLWRGTQEWQKQVEDSNLPAWFKRQMVNAAFPVFSNTVLTKDGRFSVLESPIDMGGALGTMDQRMAAHALWIQFFSAQDRKELDMYAHAQDITPQKDGRITHFVGNVHETVGDPNVGYGVTDWPDLSASWIMQTLKEYRWTGDAAFLKRNLPHVEKAIAFLKSADHDGDGIPEGGSTYDYEHLPPGAFIYNASCYLGALRAAAAAERAVAEIPSALAPIGAASPSSSLSLAFERKARAVRNLKALERAFTVYDAERRADQYDARFKAVQAATIKRLWTGDHFRKWASVDGTKVENTFVASLAGDWLAQLCGLPRTLPLRVVNAEISSLLKRHLWAFQPVPPMEVKPDGSIFTNTCYVIQHQPYLGDEAIYQGYADDGMEMQRRIYQITWEMNRSPWDESLAYDSPSGKKGGLVCYMTCPATWHTLNALTGTSLDIPNRTLYLAPHIPKSMGDLHVPVFFPTFWGRVDAVPKSKHLTLTVLKTFGSTPDLTTLIGDVDAKPIKLHHPLPVRTGAVWNLSPCWDEVVSPAKPRRKPAGTHAGGLPALL